MTRVRHACFQSFVGIDVSEDEYDIDDDDSDDVDAVLSLDVGTTE